MWFGMQTSCTTIVSCLSTQPANSVRTCALVHSDHLLHAEAPRAEVTPLLPALAPTGKVVLERRYLLPELELAGARAALPLARDHFERLTSQPLQPKRRLVVPLQWFIEHPFQNWTRNQTAILGTVILWTDYRMPVEPIRHEAERICRAAPEWNQVLCVTQVTDTTERAMQVRVLVSAGDAGACWDLRCRMREELVDFIQREFPQFLPRLRTEVDGGDPAVRQAAVKPI